MRRLLKAAGYSKSHCIRFAKVQRSPLFTAATLSLESAFSLFPRKFQRRVSPKFFQGVTMAAVK